jgi:hypothetical protein
MKSERFTENDKMVLRGLCSHPWANDREIAEAKKLKMSTVTACKNRMRREDIFKKAYFPAYYRLGYPLISLSQIKWIMPSEAVLKALLKFKDNRVDADNKTIVSFVVNDPLNAFVMAYHVDYIAFKAFEKVFGRDMGWSHELHTMEGAIKVVDFKYTNIINKLFFPDKLELYKPITVKNDPFKFHMIEKKVFDGLIMHSGEFSEAIAKKINGVVGSRRGA